MYFMIALLSLKNNAFHIFNINDDGHITNLQPAIHDDYSKYRIDANNKNQRLLFFSPDYHNGTQIDLVSSITKFGHSIYFSTPECRLPSFFIPKVPVVDGNSYNVSKSQVIFASTSQCMKTPVLTYEESDVIRMMKIFNNDTIFQKVDAIICMFVPTLCQIFLPFNKTTIFLVAHRFFLRRCKREENLKFINWVSYGNGDGAENNHRGDVKLIAAGIYDAEYINYYTGLDVPIIYSQHFFDYIKPALNYPISDDIVMAPFRYVSFIYKEEMMAACRKVDILCSFTTIKEKFGTNFHVDRISYFKAAILFPYAVLSYYINDIIASGIPMFVPSPSFLVKMKTMISYRTNQGYYCNGKLEEPPRNPHSRHLLSPESDSDESQIYWYKYASFYTPNTIQFNNWNDLAYKIKTTNYSLVFNKNLEYIEDMKKHNIYEWNRLFQKIDRNRRLSNSYTESKEFYNISSFV